MNYVIPQKYLDSQTKYHIQPSGKFIIGGPQGDAGLTGRKIIVDTYGAGAPTGEGPSLGRISPKWTVPPLTLPDGWPSH